MSESSRFELLSKCKICGQDTCVTLKRIVGTMILVDVQCSQGHDYTWRCQSMHNAMPLGQSVVVRGNIIQRWKCGKDSYNVWSHEYSGIRYKDIFKFTVRISRTSRVEDVGFAPSGSYNRPSRPLTEPWQRWKM